MGELTKRNTDLFFHRKLVLYIFVHECYVVLIKIPRVTWGGGFVDNDNEACLEKYAC